MTGGYTYNEVLFKPRNDSHVTGGHKPPLPLRKPSQMAMHVRPKGGQCGAEAGRRRQWPAGLGAMGWALPTYTERESGGTKVPRGQARTQRSASKGPISPATSAAPGPRGGGSRCSLWAKQGGNHHHLPLQPSWKTATSFWLQQLSHVARK